MKLIESISLPKVQWYCTREVEKILLVAVDCIAMIAAFFFSIIIMSIAKDSAIANEFSLLLAKNNSIRIWNYFFLTTLTIGALLVKGHYSTRRPYWNGVRDILHITLICALIDSALFFLGQREFSRGSFIINWLLAPCFLILLRSILKHLLTAAGGWVQPMVIIGWGGNALETARAFEDEALMGYRIIAFLIPDGNQKFANNYKDRNGVLIPCISLGKNPEFTLTSLGNPHIVVALEQGGIDDFQGLIQDLSRRYENIQIVPSLRGLPLYGMEVSHFFSHEVLLLTVRNNLSRRGPRLLKRCFDLFTAIFLLILISPLLLWIGLKVFSSGHPIFYGHKRVGQHGKHFLCYKFRTMLPNSDKLLQELLANDPAARDEWQRDFKLKNDPRITSIGKFLRKTSLDELPQLWNVLRGEMSFVGPRPIVDAELERYGNQINKYLEVKPGISGLWQISGRNDVTYETRVYLDVWYVKNWSLFNDIVILLKTAKVIFKKDGAY